MKILIKSLIAAAIGSVVISAPLTAFAGDLYGSVAYSQKTGNYGWAVDSPTQEAAESAAVEQCGKDDCKVAMSVVNGCVALAVGGDGGFGSDWGSNSDAAQNKAMHVCDGYSYSCKIQVVKCVTGVQ